MSRPPHRVRTKICGITRPDEARACADAGADALGLVLWHGSPRGVTSREARAISSAVPPFVARVGVFVDASPDEIATTVRELRLDWVQLAGEQDPATCREIRARIGGARIMRTFRLEPGADPAAELGGFELDAHHVDARAGGRPGGTGVRAPWELAARMAQLVPHLILAGGLDAGNVDEAVRTVGPWGVDVASGVEREPGVKDVDRVRAFIAAAQRASAPVVHAGESHDAR